MIRSSGADPKLAAELIALHVEVMLAAATPAAKAAQSATTKIAIVMADPGDAVQLRLLASLARPGANITGVTSLAPELVSMVATSRLSIAGRRAAPNVFRKSRQSSLCLTFLKSNTVPALRPSDPDRREHRTRHT